MKIQRKYMAHYLNARFASDSTGKDDYIRLGKDLEAVSYTHLPGNGFVPHG